MDYVSEFDLGVYEGYDIGFEEGAWAGYRYAIDTIKEKGLKKQTLIIVGTAILTLSISFVGLKVFNHLKNKKHHE